MTCKNRIVIPFFAGAFSATNRTDKAQRMTSIPTLYSIHTLVTPVYLLVCLFLLILLRIRLLLIPPSPNSLLR